jgi:hypothetical protein
MRHGQCRRRLKLPEATERRPSVLAELAGPSASWSDRIGGRIGHSIPNTGSSHGTLTAMPGAWRFEI